MSAYARGAAMLCGTPTFREFLRYKTRAAVESADSAAVQVRQLCGVESRRELDCSEAAGRAWRTLVGEFNQWAHARRYPMD